MVVQSSDSPAKRPWWVGAIAGTVFVGLFAGLQWGAGQWQSRWAHLAVGVAYAVMLLALSWGRPDSPMRSKGYYFGFGIVSLSLAVLYFALFFLGGRANWGVFAFVFLAWGMRSLYLFCRVPRQSADDSGIEQLRLKSPC